MSKIDKIEDVLGKLYDRFIMRDLAHIFAGAFALVAISYSFDKHLNLLSFVSSKLLVFVIFLFFSYFFGLLAQEIPAAIRYRKWRRIDPSDHNVDFPSIVKKIEEKHGIEPLRLIERFEYLRRFGSSLCVTSAMGFVSILTKIVLKCSFRTYGHVSCLLIDILVISGTILVSISSWRLFDRMKERIEDAKKHYLEKYGSKS